MSDPLQRYQVVGFLRVRDRPEAIVLDLDAKKRLKVFSGDKLGDYEVTQVDIDRKLVQLKGPNKKVIVLKWKKKPS